MCLCEKIKLPVLGDKNGFRRSSHILHFWALHPHSEDDWLQCCLVEEDADLPQDVVEGDGSQPCANVSEQSWTELSSACCRDNTVPDNNFPSAFPVTNRFSSLSVEYASLDPEDAVPQDVGIEGSHIQFTFLCHLKELLQLRTLGKLILSCLRRPLLLLQSRRLHIW